ncbi:hypothetical protein GJ654_18855 [Rhodoblastus acidophilus]|uniref:Uncharacterized protein n=1 Tax=Rhodoblastus acidophilus TaxID=1074 RepID=A0A6N8DW01_RHOAC|nr:hypothetical protein [Rhodoblastus acidophilus]MCW2276389.1 hypothetical protein [Rhodoblastus acidophilus]MTV33044.1 hypothetical protein [Rhodoblastus acidophilus]
MLKRTLLAGALALICASSAFADTPIVSGRGDVVGWTRVGSGTEPVQVQAFSTSGVWLSDSATAPAGAAGVVYVSGGNISPVLTAKNQWWVLPGQGAASATIGVIPVSQSSGQSIATAQRTIGVTASQIVAARTSRRAVTIANWGATDIYVGNPDVTTSTGARIPPGRARTVETSAAIYGISGSAGQAADALETY